MAVPQGLEPQLAESKSAVLTITPWDKCGRQYRIRTCDFYIPNVAHYQTVLTAEKLFRIGNHRSIHGSLRCGFTLAALGALAVATRQENSVLGLQRVFALDLSAEDADLLLSADAVDQDDRNQDRQRHRQDALRMCDDSLDAGKQMLPTRRTCQQVKTK